MRITVLVDNTADCGLKSEWGLSFLIEYNGLRILLDAGASELFEKNAGKLGLSLADCDFAVLSHAHYDHANGLVRFLELNKSAKLYAAASACAGCYSGRLPIKRYIGVPKALPRKYGGRIAPVSDVTRIAEGVTIVPHSTPGLSEIGRRERMYLRWGLRWLPDDFAHEQSLVFETEQGLVILNSCCHGGADNIINEVSAQFPGQRVRAIIGGFHLYNKPETEVRAFAERVLATGAELVCTGHCTGGRACNILGEVLGESLLRLKTGLVIEL